MNNFPSENETYSQKNNFIVGTELPNLKIQSIFGSGSFSDFLGHNLVIFFYPKDDTPGCTIEANDFSALHNEFLKIDTQVIGISKDTLDSHIKFKNKYSLTVNLISDTSEEICKTFNVIKEKNMYGKKYLGIERSTFFINSVGILKKEWRKVSANDHAKEVLDFIKKFN